MGVDLKAAAARHRDELVNTVIPFWETRCEDREFGGYFTFLDRDGSVYDTEKFMWMQWRIVYMFATLHQELEPRPRWLELARRGYDFLVEHGKDPEGNYYFALNRQGVPSAAAHSIYSECFAAMGAAALHKATGEAAHRREAESAMAHYLARMDNPKGRWDKSLPGRPRRRSLGHYMILANLGQALGHCLGTADYAKDVDHAIEVVLGEFWNPGLRLLFENVNVDGSFDLGSCAGREINVGHGLEAMWFILERAEATGDRAVVAKAAEIVLALLDFGWDKRHGGIFYFMDALGKPHVELQADMKLWWVHNEATLAALYAHRLTGDSVFLDWFERLDQWSWSHFRDGVHGEWFGYLDRQGEPSNQLKGGKWKGFFHLPRFLLKASRLLADASVPSVAQCVP